MKSDSEQHPSDSGEPSIAIETNRQTLIARNARAAAIEWTLVCGVIALWAWFAGGTRGALALSPGDPGPWLVPWAAAAVLAVASALEGLASCLRPANRTVLTNSRNEGCRQTWRLILLCGAYVAAAPVIGLGAVTVVFGTIFLVWHSWRWWSAGLAALGLALYVTILFEKLLKVPLPRGWIGW